MTQHKRKERADEPKPHHEADTPPQEIKRKSGANETAKPTPPRQDQKT